MGFFRKKNIFSTEIKEQPADINRKI